SNSLPVGAYPIVPALNDPNGRLPNYTVSLNDGTLTVASGAILETNLAQWTFETSQPGANEDAGVWFSNIVAEVGIGTASARHQDATAYTNVVGNGSLHAFDANNWNVGDFFQFACPTLGALAISASFDAVASPTGPGWLQFQYSTNGVNFSNAGAPLQVYV